MTIKQDAYRQWLHARREFYAANDFERSVMLGIDPGTHGHGYFVVRRVAAIVMWPLAVGIYALQFSATSQFFLLMAGVAH